MAPGIFLRVARVVFPSHQKARISQSKMYQVGYISMLVNTISVTSRFPSQLLLNCVYHGIYRNDTSRLPSRAKKLSRQARVVSPPKHRYQNSTRSVCLPKKSRNTILKILKLARQKLFIKAIASQHSMNIALLSSLARRRQKGNIP